MKDVLLTSVQEDLTDKDAIQFQSDILNAIRKRNAKGVVIDITGLDIIDSFMARILAETAVMVKILGAESVVCGMQPAVALTLVEMGRELSGVNTALDLDQGMGEIRILIDKGQGH